MKKIISTLILMFSFYFFSTLSVGVATSNTNNNTGNSSNIEMELTKKLADLEKEIRIKNLIQYVEFESEVIIPDYINFDDIEYAFNLANKLELSTRMVFRLMYQESSFVDTIVSPKGAEGLMQLMPETRQTYYELLRVDTLNLDKNQEDIYIGMNYLKDLHAFWLERGNPEKISWKLSLASYNSGKGTVLKYRGIPPYKETTDFVTFILKAHSNPDFFAHYSKKYENQIKNNT